MKTRPGAADGREIVKALLKRARCLMRREVGRCAHNSHTHVGRNPHRNHAACDRFAGADSSVEPFGDDVGQAVVDDDLDLNVGIPHCR